MAHETDPPDQDSTIRVACRETGAGSSSTAADRRRTTYASTTFAEGGTATAKRRKSLPPSRPSANTVGSAPPDAPSPLFTNAMSIGRTTRRRALSTAGFIVAFST
jgi:hypothetical protein